MAELEKKYELILGQEEHFAYSLGKEVIDKPAASAWMILLPVLFVHHAYRIKRYKEGVQSFARGILDPRKKALDAAAHEVRTKTSLPCTMEYLYPEITASAPEKDRSLAEKQVGVIRIHQQHYRNLLSAPGDSYAELVKNAYPEQAQYRRFLDRLMEAERDLNRYLTGKIHTDQASKEVVRKMEICCSALRKQEIRNLY